MRFPQNTPTRKLQPFKLSLRERGKPQTSRVPSRGSRWMSGTGVHYLGSPTVGSALSGVSCCPSRGTGTRYVDLTLLHNWLNASRQYFYLHKVWIRFARMEGYDNNATFQLSFLLVGMGTFSLENTALLRTNSVCGSASFKLPLFSGLKFSIK